MHEGDLLLLRHVGLVAIPLPGIFQRPVKLVQGVRDSAYYYDLPGTTQAGNDEHPRFNEEMVYPKQVKEPLAVLKWKTMQYLD